jgi:putative FmdB family regulatory protein
MPTYDYRCATCGIEFDLFQSFSDDALKKCPTKGSGNSPAGCTSPGRGKVEKVFSAPGITFKGSGFYKTDSRPGKKKTTTSSGDRESSSDTKSADSKASDTSSSKGSDSASTTESGPKAPDSSSTKKSSD